MDQVYGAVPPAAVQVAEYGTPTCVGPVVGTQEIVTGLTCALATLITHRVKASIIQRARAKTRARENQPLNRLRLKNIWKRHTLTNCSIP
jgi:hypothetical protein